MVRPSNSHNFDAQKPQTGSSPQVMSHLDEMLVPLPIYDDFAAAIAQTHLITSLLAATITDSDWLTGLTTFASRNFVVYRYSSSRQPIDHQYPKSLQEWQ